MNNLINEFSSLIQSVPKIIRALSNTDYKPSPTKWSKKEILGHLCDSATMNHKRFIDRLSSNDELVLELYKQNSWVELNDYQNCYSIEEILAVWSALNSRFMNVLANISEDQWKLQYSSQNEESVTLSWLFTDYIDHMKHHLNQILG
ncbi:DinB family protein [Gottfriedia acidiceleris]|uniref:DinB family protein n=1 Tax=Gottfriedia acidiceleris TaxID=371036 RepID=A0ABY4JR58_9BACI|nr:DinB family protein [Gottfriedia acidiceleris]UPM55157.1 DinB family protein [Gottfriedia acidiceleris]